jgi:hypothetical protein
LKNLKSFGGQEEFVPAFFEVPKGRRVIEMQEHEDLSRKSRSGDLSEELSAQVDQFCSEQNLRLNVTVDSKNSTWKASFKYDIGNPSKLRDDPDGGPDLPYYLLDEVGICDPPWFGETRLLDSIHPLTTGVEHSRRGCKRPATSLCWPLSH